MRFQGLLMFFDSRSALRELRSAAGGLETVLAGLFARSPCIYLVLESRHPQFPQSLTNEEILLYSPAAPVPVQIRALVIAFKEHCAHGNLAHAVRFADKDQLLHRFPLPKI